MRAPQLTAAGSVSINMTPMIDVVFLLIIFFLVSSHLAKQESSVRLDLPKAKSVLPDNRDRTSLVVNVLATGQWQVGGVAVTADRLQDLLRRRMASTSEPIQLKIRTDQQVIYEKVEPLLGLAATLGITDIVFAAFEKRAGTIMP